MNKINLLEIDKIHEFPFGTSDALFNCIESKLEKDVDYFKSKRMKYGEDLYLTLNGYLTLYASMPKTEEIQKNMRKVVYLFSKKNTSNAADNMTLIELVNVLEEEKKRREKDGDLETKNLDVEDVHCDTNEKSFGKEMIKTAEILCDGDLRAGYWHIMKVIDYFCLEGRLPKLESRLKKDQLAYYIDMNCKDFKKEFEDVIYELKK